MAGLHFQIVGDNSDFLRRLAETQRAVSATSKRIEQQGIGIDQYLSKLAKGAAALGVGFSATQLIKDIIQIRGEFQQLEIAFETMLGSKVKAETLMSQLTQTAAKTPFDLQGIANGAKQLLAYGIEAEKVNDTLVRLGNIASGLSLNLNDLVWLYGTTMTQGRLFTQDLRQFMGRGIPLAEELAEQFGVTTDKVGELVTAGKVGFPEVQKAIEAMTNEGGKFYNLMEKQSSSLTGQISNLSDAWDMMLNEIGTKTQGIASAGIATTASLVENYDKVGKAIAAIAATYGTYKAALIAARLLENGTATARLAHIKIIQLQTAAQTALNIVTKANPYVLLATAVVGLGAAMWTFHDSTTESEKALDRFNKKQEEAQKLEQEHKQKIDSLVQSSRDIALSDLQRGQSLAELRKEYPKIFEQYDIESIKLADILKLKQQIAAEDTKRAGEKQEKELSNIEAEIKYYENLLKSLSGQQGIDGYVKKLKELRADRDVLLQEKGKGISEQFISGLNNIDISEFDRYIAELEKRIKGKGENGKIKLRLPIDVKGSLSDEAIYDVKDIKTLIDTAKSKKLSRIDEEKNKTTYQEDLANAKAEWEKAKKGYEALIKDQKSTSKQVKEAKDDMETAEKRYKDLGGVTGSSLIKQENQAKKELEEKIKQQEQLAEQLLSIRRKNQQDEINLMEDGTERKLKQIDLDYQKELDAIKKQKAEWEKTQGGKLTEEQTSLLGERASNNAKAREKAISAVNKEELEANKKAWQEYYIEFGNYQEKRKNLVQKYNDELAKLQKDSPEYAIKEAEKSKAIEQLDEQYGKSTKAMADLFEDASDKSVNAIQAIIDKYELLVSYLSGGNGVTVEDLKAVGFTDKDLKSIEDGTINIKDVTDSIKNLKGTLAGKSPFKKFSEDIKEGIGNLKNAKGDTDAIGRGISKIGNAVVEFSGPLKEFSSNIGNIFGFDDSKIQGSIDAVSGLGQTAAGVGQIMSGDIVGGAMSAVSGISSVVSALDGMFGADYSRYNDMVEEYTRLNEIWDELIDKKQEYIDISYGVEADKVGEEALSLVEKQVEAYRLLGKERLNSGASVGSHSIGKRMVKNTSSSDWQDIANALDMSVNAAKEFIGTGRMTGLFDLTAEQLEKLKSEAPAFWAKMDGDVQEYLNGIIEGEERIEDIQNQVKEQLTQTTFDSVFDSFVDTLMDMDSSAKDFAEDFSEYMQRAILTNMVGEKFSKELQDWYDSFAEAGKDEEGITKGDMEDLRKQYEEIVDAAVAERNKLVEIFGWTGEATQQSASSRGFQSMSQDTGEELNGRFTALQIAGEEIKNQSITQTSLLQMIYGLVSAIIIPAPTEQTGDDTTFMSSVPASADSGNGEVASQLISLSMATNSLLGVNQEGFNNILLQMVQTNSYLEDIYTIQKKMWEQWSRKFDEMTKSLNHAFG